MNKWKRVSILGCPFDAISFDETVDLIKRTIEEGRHLQLVPGSIDFVMKARKDPQFSKDLWQAGIVFADGVPILWAAALLGTPLAGRVSGTDIVWSCAEISARVGASIAMIGGDHNITVLAAKKMNDRYPQARLYPINTPFTLGENENAMLVERIIAANAKIVLVALGAPRQERWVKRYLNECGANVGIGIGSAFDIISGNKPRAPLILRDYGFEWLHRMLIEPRRLGKRYLIEDTPFIWELAFEVIRKRLLRRKDQA